MPVANLNESKNMHRQGESPERLTSPSYAEGYKNTYTTELTIASPEPQGPEDWRNHKPEEVFP